MTDHAKNLRCTRVDMLGTDDEEHYWHCVAAAKYITELELLPCKLDCRAKREKDFMGGFDAGLAYPDKEPGEAWKEWRDEKEEK